MLDESAARYPIHRRADDGVGGDAFEQARAAGDEENRHYRNRSENRDDLLDAAFARAHLRYVLSDRRAAVGAHAAALDHQVSSALWAFDFRS